MRIGFVTDDVPGLEWGKQNGFRSIEWNRFELSGAGPDHNDWRPFAERFASEASSRGIRISAIGALYKNPLDPAQSDYSRTAFLRAIEVAQHIGCNTVAGFPGAVIELETNPKGLNPVYKPFEPFLPRLIEFWDPIGHIAADKGVRIAFE